MALRCSSKTPFWTQPRPIKTSHSDTRPRTRSRSMTFVETEVKSGVTFEVENFRIYGGLRKTETEVRNTLPTAMTIETEKTLLCFEKQRKKAPADADYSNFYRCLSASVSSQPSTSPAPHLEITPLPPALAATSDGDEGVGDRDGPPASRQYLQVVPAYLRH